MSGGRTDEQLFNLMSLGLTWVQTSTHGVPTGWTGNGILQTLRHVGAISDHQYRSLARAPHETVRSYFLSRSALVWPKSTAPRNQPRVSELIAHSDKLLVILINTGMFCGEKIFIPGGYKLLVTESGQEYAQRAAPTYQREMPHDTFWGQWVAHRRQMGGMFASSSRRGGNPES